MKWRIVRASSLRLPETGRAAVVPAVLLALIWAMPQPMSAQDPSSGTDVFAVMTQPGGPAIDDFDLGPEDSNPDSTTWGWLIPGPGNFGIPVPGPTSNRPPLLSVPLLRRQTTDTRPCGSNSVMLTPRMYFEAEVQHMQCAADGVSPGVHRMCSDLAAVEQTRPMCLDWRDGVPKIPASIIRETFLCENGVDPTTHAVDTRCQRLVHQEVCADLIRLQSEIDQSPGLLAVLQDPRNRQVNSPYWPQTTYVVSLQSRIQACKSAGYGQPAAQRFGTKKACADPDWVRQYRAEGASPPIRYQVGFNQGVAKCLQDQCTLANLSVAIWASAFGRVGQVLAISSSVSMLDAIVHPPGFSTNPDPYERGKEEGSRLCAWMLRLTPAANARRIPLMENGKINIPAGFNFEEALATMPKWIAKINPTQCDRNCGPATANAIRALFGQPLEAAPATTKGWTDQQMEDDLGGKFNAVPMTDVDMMQRVESLPNGTVGAISTENPNYSGSTPPGPLTNWNNIPGHIFLFVKTSGGVQFWDPQNGSMQSQLPDNWIYRTMVVGNPSQGH
jgi:hypothetical protein